MVTTLIFGAVITAADAGPVSVSAYTGICTGYRAWTPATAAPAPETESTTPRGVTRRRNRPPRVECSRAILGLPLAPLCREDCLGPGPATFPLDLADPATGSDDEATERPRDPRWAALDELRAQFGDDSDPPDSVG